MPALCSWDTFEHCHSDYLGQNIKGRLTMERRNFFLLVTLVTVAATPAWGQSVPTRIGDPQNAVSIPDMSGIWGHSFLTGGFEPPALGPGPVTNRTRRNGVSDVYQFVGDYTNPILKPQAAEQVKRHGEISLTGVTYPTPGNQCWPESPPVIFGNQGMLMLQQPHQITILYSNDHAVRRVRLNQSHPAQLTPSWHGDSVGHYEGNELVIDTAGVKVGPFAMVDRYGTPYTQALHVVERYRLVDSDVAKEAEERGKKENQYVPNGEWSPDPNYKGKALQLRFTVADEGVFTMPWSATITYRRPIGEWREEVCAENRHEYYNNKNADVPTADKADF
jgi:hypothetical protein